MTDESNIEIQQDAEPGSVLSRLREIRQEFTEETTKDLDVPGYRGMLVARYSPLPWEVLRGLAARAEQGKRNPNIAPTVAADGLANAIVGFYVRTDDGLLAPLTLHGEPIERYDRALAQALGIEGVETPREITVAVFPDPLALVSHYGALMEWQSERADDDEERLIEAARMDDSVRPTSS